MSERGLGPTASESDSGETGPDDFQTQAVDWVVKGFTELKQDRVDGPVYSFGPYKWYEY